MKKPSRLTAMKRNILSFLNATSVLNATLVILFAFPAVAITREIELVQDFAPKLVNGTGDLYVPLPQKNTPYQKILDQKNSGNATSVEIKKISIDGNKSNDIEVLHARWEKVDQPKLQVVHKLRTEDRESPMKEKSNTDFFLKPTKHVQTDGIVRETADKITSGLQDPDKKALAIYDWVVENTSREASTRGCGLGDVKTLLQSGNFRGKCADLNSLFVGLARAAEIPAREVWGLRVVGSKWQEILGKEGDVTKSQHCRAEYYSKNKKAWVSVDPADIRKLILDGKLKLEDAEVQKMKKTLFGKTEGNWVAYNYGRDFQLPGQEKAINYFMYPQMITAGNSPDGMDPTEVSYTITSKLIK